MGRPAARVGDMTLCGPLKGAGAGSTDVMIGGMAAWRATMDMHQCTLSVPSTITPPAPHVGGVAIPGSSTVFINNTPAARMGDTITETGFVNSITAGCKTVLIG